MTDGGLDYTFECVGNVNTMVRAKILYKFCLISQSFIIRYKRLYTSEGCVRILPQRMGHVRNNRGGCGRGGNQNQAVPIGHRPCVEGKRIWRMEIEGERAEISGRISVEATDAGRIRHSQIPV